MWALGVKEVWEVPKPLDRVIHTLGWPLRYGAKHQEFGGSWIYPMGDDRVSIGFVVGLDYTDATVSGHDLLQQFKTSKLVRGILEGGERVAWGAKAIPEGGYWAMPKLTAPGHGHLPATPAAWSTCPVLKGIHYAIHAGILAAEEIFAAAQGAARPTSRATSRRVEDSLIGKELYESRNMKQPFAKGFFVGGAITNAMVVTKGRFPGGRWSNHRDAEAPVYDRRRRRTAIPSPTASTPSTSSRASTSRATRPATTRPTTSACASTCRARWPRRGRGCARPGSTRSPRTRPRTGNVDVIVNYTNCVQCGAITAKGGRLTTPEGGDGPLYQVT